MFTLFIFGVFTFFVFDAFLALLKMMYFVLLTLRVRGFALIHFYIFVMSLYICLARSSMLVDEIMSALSLYKF